MNAQHNGAIIGSLREALYETKTLEDVPPLINKILTEESWREFYDEVADEVVTHPSFYSFVTTEPPQGLGTSIERLAKLCSDDMDLCQRIQDAGKHQGRRSNLRYNITEVRGKVGLGTSRIQALRRLKKDAPAIHQRVLNNELSPNAGMIEAGFRKKTVTMPTDLDSLAKALRRRYSDEELETLYAKIRDGADTALTHNFEDIEIEEENEDSDRK